VVRPPVILIENFISFGSHENHVIPAQAGIRCGSTERCPRDIRKYNSTLVLLVKMLSWAIRKSWKWFSALYKLAAKEALNVSSLTLP